MNNRLNEILTEIRELEKSVQEELKRKEEELRYTAEIAARSEQYWCPIKHATGKAQRHSRYHQFFDYGDAEAYSRKLGQLRKEFTDLSDTKNI